MRYFGVLISRTSTLAPSIVSQATCASKTARRTGTTIDEPETWSSRSGRVMFMAWGNDPKVGLYSGQRIVTAGHFALVGSGYYYDSAFSSDRDLVEALAHAPDPDRIIAKLGGVFVLCLCDGESDRVRVWNTLAGSPNVLYRETSQLIAIATRGLWVSLVTEQSATPTYDPQAFGPFILNEYYPTEATPYRGVKRMGVHTALAASATGVRERSIDDIYER